ncbi:ethanolamine ammonia-lyase [Robbsia andropogonis]|uniref:Ethanolamine ammonia-lyase small subunit n=1 Tax=Robbsia andropogonis TaxID=28092 RepID=A0A0F5K0N2_9BURK|nr:ethanolamine ammonia-lyase subunit EutC [Robbsia andropogonis]KKB63671.1 ethanolamine ammonia-lyase [Robbsia andropogonis]MCP1119327.1 ethanolamine ammonia-lyase subunit EutC [Robbsia andropogonis]MCP1129167.1 ethanolamine ammonia-lyase subunit EutC [Robbsia andropogonis]
MSDTPKRRDDDGNVKPDVWGALRKFTDARIALGRSGSSLPTAPLLAFNLAHARARDAVHTPLDVAKLVADFHTRSLQTLEVKSAATNRDIFLRRPDLGRHLDEESKSRLFRMAKQIETKPDLIFVICDGLSSQAVAHHAVALIERTIARLPSWRIGPVVIVTQGRVAAGDVVGEILEARMVAVLVGERPGLSSPASLGVYLTFAPRVGCSDAERNCISNVRPEGLTYDAAAFKLAYLADAARTRKITGVNLKDDSGYEALPGGEDQRRIVPDKRQSNTQHEI